MDEMASLISFSMEEFDWDHIFEDIPDNPPRDQQQQDPGLFDSFEELKELLMKDDADLCSENSSFTLSDILLDTPVANELEDKCSPASTVSQSEGNVDANSGPGAASPATVGNSVDAASDGSENGDKSSPSFEEDDRAEQGALETNDSAEDDPVTKKRKRQLRNRDAAMRSRERKKIYVKDLEMKSKYLEGECRRLGRLLQCCYAENQMLRISLQSAMAKPESAVLLPELLLLGSLVWFMALMLLFPLPILPLFSQGAVALGSKGRKDQEGAAPKGKGTKPLKLGLPFSFMRSKRCRASRTRMKSDFRGAMVVW